MTGGTTDKGLEELLMHAEIDLRILGIKAASINRLKSFLEEHTDYEGYKHITVHGVLSQTVLFMCLQKLIGTKSNTYDLKMSLQMFGIGKQNQFSVIGVHKGVTAGRQDIRQRHF